LECVNIAIAKLALLTAFSSFQVDKTVIDEFKTYRDDGKYVKRFVISTKALKASTIS
jgi:hypothetical protein